MYPIGCSLFQTEVWEPSRQLCAHKHGQFWLYGMILWNCIQFQALQGTSINTHWKDGLCLMAKLDASWHGQAAFAMRHPAWPCHGA